MQGKENFRMASRVTISKTSDEGDIIKIYLDFETINNAEEKEIINKVKLAIKELKEFNKTIKAAGIK
jgi:hypothetical protein